MKLVVGLGNAGRRYTRTRHNVGFDVLDALAARHHLEWEAAPRGLDALSATLRSFETLSVVPSHVEGRHAQAGSGDARAPHLRFCNVIIAKPLTFMNLSGPAVVGLLQFFKIELPDLLIIVDDVNLELGRLRARAAGSAGGHNGLKSIIDALGAEEFPRLRIGVGRGDTRRDLADHVLAKFEPSERAAVDEAVGRAADAAELFVDEGIGPVMNRFNRKEDAD